MLNSKNVLFVIFLVISIVFISGGDQDRLNKAQFVGKYFFIPYTASISYFKNLAHISQKNEELKKQLFNLQSKNRQYKEEILRDERLSRLLDAIDSSHNAAAQVEVARVIGTGSFLNYETLSVDIGHNKGIIVNLPVISTQGLIGKTVAVYPNYSVVQTFGSKYFRMGALDSRSRVQGIVEIDFNGKVYLKKIKVGSDLELGDEIVTSKLSAIFPPGISFGKIINIEQTSEGLFAKAEIAPFANLAKVEEVAIIRNYEK
jgi:rod shape-determining protein MreC